MMPFDKGDKSVLWNEKLSSTCNTLNISASLFRVVKMPQQMNFANNKINVGSKSKAVIVYKLF